MSQKPSIGRIVHYQRHGSPDGTHKSEPSPGIVTQVFPDEDGGMAVQLTIFNPNGWYVQKTMYSEEPKPGHWSWPPRV